MNRPLLKWGKDIVKRKDICKGLLLQNRFQPIIGHIIELLPIGKFELTKAFRLSAQARANRGHYIDPPTPYFFVSNVRPSLLNNSMQMMPHKDNF